MMKYLKEYYNYKPTYYHGSSKELDTLKVMPRESGESKFLGDGIYISNNREISEKYGKFLYEVSLLEDLKPLQYIEDIPLDRFIEIINYFNESTNPDHNYIGDKMEDDMEDGETWYGVNLIREIEREGLDVNKTLLDIGYNSIEAPINMLNQFRGNPDSDRNINVIKPNILTIKKVG